MTYDEAIEQVRNGKAVHRPEWPPESIIVLENTGPRGEKSPVRYYLDNTAGFPSDSYFPFSPTPDEEATDWEEWAPPSGRMPRFAWD